MAHTYNKRILVNIQSFVQHLTQFYVLSAYYKLKNDFSQVLENKIIRFIHLYAPVNLFIMCMRQHLKRNGVTVSLSLFKYHNALMFIEFALSSNVEVYKTLYCCRQIEELNVQLPFLYPKSNYCSLSKEMPAAQKNICNSLFFHTCLLIPYFSNPLESAFSIYTVTLFTSLIY